MGAACNQLELEPQTDGVTDAFTFVDALAIVIVCDGGAAPLIWYAK
jgi:hypothetical protein